MTQTEKDKLKQILQLTYPEADPTLIDQIISINADLTFEEAQKQSEIILLNRLILELDEKIKLGEIETQNTEKLKLLKERLQTLQQERKQKARIISLE
ncbi:MAG: hypothetical protein GXO21_05880 [Aquificae bacterium]|jgi:hypothetical protein|nr:hypothetical protein [Aquificota bacterium]